MFLFKMQTFKHAKIKSQEQCIVQDHPVGSRERVSSLVVRGCEFKVWPHPNLDVDLLSILLIVQL